MITRIKIPSYEHQDGSKSTASQSGGAAIPKGGGSAWPTSLLPVLASVIGWLFFTIGTLI